MNLKTLSTSLLMLVFGAQMSLAQGLSDGDMTFAFGGSSPTGVQEVQRSAPPPVALSDQEMVETEGEVLPLFAIGALSTAGRFVVQRYATRTIAANAARSGCNVFCFGSSQQARSLATQAYGRGNVLRHGPSGHVRSPSHYSHYQSLSRSPRGHIFYGRPYSRPW